MPNKKIKLVYPQNTLPVSLTGDYCSLSCRHCNGQYLKGMKDISLVNSPKRIPSHITSFLISGGCNREGSVPVEEHITILKKLKNANFKLNIHTALIPKEKIYLLRDISNAVSFDFITDNKTIKEVYGLQKQGQNYIETYNELIKYVPVIPHITIGLYEGKIKGEYESIDILSQMNCEKIVFLVLIPTKGTYYEKCLPSSLNEVEKFLSYAREKMPKASFGLGCMHPRGQYKYNLEVIGLKYKFNSFVNPSPYLYNFLIENTNFKKGNYPKKRALKKEINFLKDWIYPNTDVIISKECCVL